LVTDYVVKLLLVLVDLTFVALSAIKRFREVLSGDHDWSTIENLFVSVDDDVLEQEGSVTRLLEPQIIKPGLLNLLLDHLKVNHEVDHNQHTDETEAEDNRLLIVLLILSKLDRSFLKLINVIGLIFFHLILLDLVLNSFLLNEGYFLHGVVHGDVVLGLTVVPYWPLGLFLLTFDDGLDGVGVFVLELDFFLLVGLLLVLGGGVHGVLVLEVYLGRLAVFLD